MGALHDGHLSLLSAARQSAGFVAMTLFVNPLQFGEATDLAAYPRDLARDLDLAEHAGADAVFTPTVREMYPVGRPETRIVPGRLATMLEGESRPGHLEGVAVVVTKLFALAGSCVAFFGEKDYQQLVIVRRLVADLDLPVEVAGCPIVRDHDGVALSSRNRRLSAEERGAAVVLSRALAAGRLALEKGHAPREAEGVMADVLAAEPLVQRDYAVVRDAETLEPVTGTSSRGAAATRAGGANGVPPSRSRLRLLVAARIGPVRLIDNMAAA